MPRTSDTRRSMAAAQRGSQTQGVRPRAEAEEESEEEVVVGVGVGEAKRSHTRKRY